MIASDYVTSTNVIWHAVWNKHISLHLTNTVEFMANKILTIYHKLTGTI